MVEKNKLRFNNISDYDFKNEDYIVFGNRKKKFQKFMSLLLFQKEKENLF
jgi:hypothetical protein